MIRLLWNVWSFKIIEKKKKNYRIHLVLESCTNIWYYDILAIHFFVESYLNTEKARFNQKTKKYHFLSHFIFIFYHSTYYSILSTIRCGHSNNFYLKLQMSTILWLIIAKHKWKSCELSLRVRILLCKYFVLSLCFNKFVLKDTNCLLLCPLLCMTQHTLIKRMISCPSIVIMLRCLK